MSIVSRLTPIFLLFLTACSAAGPPYPDAPEGEKLEESIGPYWFSPTIGFFRHAQRGEVIFEDSRQGHARFRLRWIGLSGAGEIRMRSYRGTAHALADRIELRAKRCYIYGRTQWAAEWKPLERWDCDHLFFQFEPGIQGRLTMLSPGRSERTEHSQFLQTFDLSPLPSANTFVQRKQEKSIPFAGQIMTAINDDSVIVWGHKASKYLREHFHLTALTKTGEPAGSLLVESRMGDLILARWLERGPEEAHLVYTTEQLPNRSWFD